ncbi:hypothetical protein AVL48_27780 [Amycolatopsis regifaucium]|uniref:Major facilitator superfamily (MFS) profile domain-containing protein n=1 Tax=Amycolatopsis regifaucium TaxID=546365 RepID=A0A154MPI5_9PSEU|nr:hypothetical protein AVL48_27780 [Amycolatopsis regifaucium]
MVNAYALTFAGLLLLGGKLAALYGRKRVFVVGLVLFIDSAGQRFPSVRPPSWRPCARSSDPVVR